MSDISTQTCENPGCPHTARYKCAQTLERAHIDGMKLCFHCIEPAGDSDIARVPITSTTFHDFGDHLTGGHDRLGAESHIHETNYTGNVTHSQYVTYLKTHYPNLNFPF